MFRIYANYAEVYNVPCYESAMQIAASTLDIEMRGIGVVEVVDEHDCLVYTISRY